MWWIRLSWLFWNKNNSVWLLETAKNSNLKFMNIHRRVHSVFYDNVSSLWNFYCASICAIKFQFSRETFNIGFFWWQRLAIYGECPALARCEATGERGLVSWPGHEVLPGGAGVSGGTPGHPASLHPRYRGRGDQTWPGRAWPAVAGVGRPGEEEPRTRGHCDHWPESECEETWASRALSQRPVSG